MEILMVTFSVQVYLSDTSPAANWRPLFPKYTR